jgi:hypothetical protein
MRSVTDRARSRRGILALTFAALLSPLAAAGPPRPSVTDAADCNREAHVRTGRPAPRDEPTLRPAPGTRTDRSGSVIAEAPDPLVEGMAAAGFGDPRTGPRTAPAWPHASRSVADPVLPVARFAFERPDASVRHGRC